MIKVTLDSAKIINNPSNHSNLRRKYHVVTGSAVDTFVKLCLRAIDRYNRENGSSNLMKNYPRSVKQLTDLTENVYKNSRSQAKALASTAMQTVQEVVDFGSNDRDASHTGTLNMLTEIYHRWNKTYPAIFWDDSALIKQPAFVSNRATGRNTLEQSNPINLILSGEKSKKEEHADLIQTPQEITPNHVMPTATDVSLI